jgi:pSer/pThr/pTyr-binding forkhead associated (FHA) protein
MLKALMNSFLTACGLEDALRLVVESQRGDEDELRLLQQPFAVVGRDPKADVVLDHPQVSRRHVYVQVVEGRAFWVDLESRTGTRGERESQRFGWLEDRRRLWVGPYAIRRFVGDSDTDPETDRGKRPGDTPLAALAYGRAPLPEVTLEFLNGPSQVMSRPVHRVMSLIGSASGCKFRLTDPSVSRFHASLLQTAAGLWIVDLLGHSGVLVNEKQVRFDRIVDGDVLRLGRYQVRVRCHPRGQSVAKGVPLDLGHRALAGSLVYRQRASNSLPVRDWPAATVPIEPRAEGINGALLPVPIQPDSLSPKVEVMPSNLSLPGKFARGDAAESVLVPLVNQFGMMQQQMFDQFQQAIAMMIQMFGEMHRDQMDVIREELGRLHDLTDELNALKQELTTRSKEPSPSISTSDFVNVAGRTRPAVSESRPFVGRPMSESRPAEDEPGLNDTEGSGSPVPAPALFIRSATAGAADPSPPGSDQFATPPVSPPLAAKPALPPRETPAPPISTKGQDTAQPAADSNRDTVLWLHQRIMVLQHERESRWQKLLKLLPRMS